MKPVTLKPFKVGYGDEQIAFYPRMMTLAEMEDVQQNLAHANDAVDKFQKRFEVFKNAISDWSNEAPKLIKKEKGEVKFIDLVENPASTKDVLDRFFGDRSAENERVIQSAFNTFCTLSQPDVDFL